jgi:hypothetical protein
VVWERYGILSSSSFKMLFSSSVLAGT